MNKLITVVLPVYNSKKFIKNTIDSILKQSYSNIEVIIIDDNSKDETVLFIKNNVNDSRIIFIELKENKGVGNARNIGIENAKGDYISFIDSDDIWDTMKIEKQLMFMEKNNITFSYTNYNIKNEYKSSFRKVTKIPNKINFNGMLKSTPIATSSVMINKKIISENRFNHMRSGQDYAFWLTLLSQIDYAHKLDEMLITYVNRKNSLSSKKLKSLTQIYYIQHKIFKINKMVVFYNLICFIINNLKKRTLG